MKNLKPITFYIIIFLMVFAFFGVSSSYDFDLWARLIAGKAVWQTGSVIYNDFLSYTPTHTWWDHEYGSGVVFYFFQNAFGSFGLVLLQVILIFLILFTSSRIIKLRVSPEICPYNFLFYFFVIMSVQTQLGSPVRCHLFSFLFFTVLIYILERVRLGQNKLLWIIPPLIILWNNLHGGVVAGIGTILIYTVGEFFNGKSFTKYLYTFVCSVLVLIINPYGIEYLKFLFSANTMERKYIVEWWPIFSNFHFKKYILFKLMIVFSFAVEIMTWVRNKIDYKALDKTKLLLMLVTFYLAFTHLKLTPFFAIVTLCFVYEDFYKLISKLNFPKYKDKIICAIVIAMFVVAVVNNPLKGRVNFKKYPIKEVEFLRVNKIEGNLLTNFGLGSWASYKLFPQNKIFMDGRYEEVYYNNLVLELKNFFLVQEDWEKVLRDYPTQILIIEKYYPIYKKMKSHKDWQLAYEGEVFGVFLRKELSKQTFQNPPEEISYYEKNIFNTDIDFKNPKIYDIIKTK